MHIQAEEVCFSYEKTLILDHINFRIEAGEFVGIFGPNGGGKTTLLELLMGFLEPSQGKLLLFGKTPQQARAWMAYVPQIARFDRQFPLTVLDIVLMGCLRHSNLLGQIPKNFQEKAENALEQVGLKNKKASAFGSLSGGEAQRVLIARALASDPKILLLDEPTASVDTSTENILYDILMELKREKTILMVSHNLPAMTKRVDQCLLISRKSTSLAPQELCEHYAMGLYHPPLSHPFHEKGKS